MDNKTLKQRIIFRRLIQGLIIVAIFVMGITSIGVENDLFWQLKMGEQIWETHTFPIVDPYNFSNPGAVWTLEEWPPSTLFYVLNKHFGYVSLIFLKTTVVALTFWLFIRLFNKLKVNLYLSFFVLLLAAMVNTRGSWAVFPSVFEYLFLVTTLFILEYYRKVTWKTVAVFVILAWIWANSHASFFLLSGILFAYVIGSFMAEKLQLRYISYTPSGFLLNKSERLKLLVAGIISLITPFLTPNGYWTFVYPFRISLGFFTPYVSEYQKYWAVWQWNWNDFVHGFTFILIFILLLVFLIFIKKLNPIDLILGIIFIGLSQIAVRHVAIFALVALFIIVKYISVGFGEYRGIFKRSLIKDLLLILFIISFLYFYKTKIVGFGLGFSEAGYPKEAAEFVMANHIQGNMFNHYNYGGYLIWKMPQYKVFIDGRLEMYQGEAGKDYLAIGEDTKNEYQKYLDKYNINFILYYSTDPFINSLMESPNWRLVYSRGNYAVFVKNSEINAEIIKKYWSEEYQTAFKSGYKEAMSEKINQMGLDEARKKNIKAAVEYFERAVEFNPVFIGARLNLAKGYMDLGWWNESNNQYNEVLNLEPGNQQANWGLEKIKQLEQMQKGFNLR